MGAPGSRNAAGTIDASSSKGLHDHTVRPKLVAAVDDEDPSVEDEVQAGPRPPPVKVVAPKQPTDKEMAEHELTNLPFRNWCKE